MTLDMETLEFVAFVLMVIVVVVNFRLSYRILTILQKEHPDTWELLGSPKMVANNRVHHSFRILKLIWSDESRLLRDRNLRRDVLATRVVHLVGCTVLLFGLVTAGLAFVGRW